MAKIQFRKMIIEITRKPTGQIGGSVINTDDFSHSEVARMNKNLEKLIDAYRPFPGSFFTSTTNAIALWIVNGLGKEAEIIEYDKAKQDPDLIY